MLKIIEDEVLICTNLRGTVVYASREALEVFGYSRRDVGKFTISDIFLDESAIRDVLSTPREWSFREVRCRKRDGSEMWMEIRYKAIDGGKIAIVARDVTEKKKLEKKIRESEEMFRVLAEKSLIGIYLIQDGVFRYVNPKMAELWGYEVSELVGRSPLEFIHPEDRELVKRNIDLRISGKVDAVNYRLRMVRKDGEVRINEVYGSRIIFRGKPAVIGTLVDVTDVVKMQEEIERLNKLLRILNEIGQLIARERDADALLDRVVEKLSEFYPVAAVCHASKMRLKCHASVDEERISEIAGDELLDVPVEFRDSGISTIVIPLKVDGEVVGRLILQSSVGFSEDERELLRTLADDLTLAIRAVETEVEKWIAFEQIGRNIENFALLVDQIRNPLAAISLLTEMEVHGETREKILEQVRRIDRLISMLDEGWLESERVSRHLKKIW